jgi:hypothetical protein
MTRKLSSIIPLDRVPTQVAWATAGNGARLCPNNHDEPHSELGHRASSFGKESPRRATTTTPPPPLPPAWRVR